MPGDQDEDKLLQSVALQNAQAVLLARERVERELIAAKEALEIKSAALAEQREFFQVTLASIGDAVITTDTEGCITFLNHVAAAMTGWQVEDALSLPLEKVLQIIDEETRRPAAAPIDKALREGAVVGFSNHTALIARDGAEIPIDHSAAPIRDASGKISGVVMIFRDVTDRRRSDRALRESNERATNILDSITDAFIVLDKDWRFTYVNRQAEQVFEPLKHSRSNLLGRNFWEVFPDLLGTPVEHAFRRATAGRVKEEFEIFYPPLNAWFELRVYPAADGLSIYFLDITDRKRVAEIRKEAEEQLRRSEEELRTLADSIPQLAWMADADGFIFWYNRGWYEYTGTTLQEMEGWGWQAVHDPQLLPTVMERWADCIRTGTQFEMEFPLRGADGVFRWFLTRVRPVRDREGRITRWFGTNTNIDEQRQLLRSLEEARDHLEKRVQERTHELQDANEDLGKLSASLLRVQDDEQRRIARELHDSVGQLLVAISMNISAVQAESHNLSHSAAKCVEDNAQLLEQVTREIRTLSHLLHPPLLDEAGLASAIRWYIEGFADRSKIDVRLDIPPDFGRLSEDSEIAIFRVVQECLTNIHRHSGSSTATIGIKRDGQYLTVEVRDTGHGIPPERLREITVSGRTGVGLAGMRERVKQLGGTLDIQSDPSGTLVRTVFNVGVPD